MLAEIKEYTENNLGQNHWGYGIDTCKPSSTRKESEPLKRKNNSWVKQQTNEKRGEVGSAVGKNFNEKPGYKDLEEDNTHN